MSRVLDSEVLATVGTPFNAEAFSVLLHGSILINVRCLLIVEGRFSIVSDPI
jgi:hypothetical protein